LARADQETSRLHREFVRGVVDLVGKPPTRVAKEAGLAASTLTRMLNAPEDSTQTLHARTIRKLEQYVALVGGNTSTPPGPGGLAEEAVRFDAEGADPAVSAAIAALIGSRATAVPWTIRTRALECMGYLPGDIVIVELGRPPQQGDVVWAEVYNLGRSDAEMVMRIYRPPILAVASLDQQLGGPLMVDDARVIIRGVVLPHRLRPRGPTALIG
jgi:hypothetical protein